MPMPQWLARFNRRVTNQITRTFAGHVPGFGIVIHTGRRSGRTYRTPVNVFRIGNDYIIALTYGPDTDWVRNVLAADGSDLVTQGRTIHLTNPCLIADPSLGWAPLPVRLALDLFNAPEYLRLTCAPASA